MRKFVLCGPLALAACVTTQVVPLDLTAPRRRPVCPQAVTIYTARDRIEGGFDEVAVLHSSGNDEWTNETGMVASMREKAGQAGATGIIIEGFSEPTTGAKVASVFLPVPTDRKGRSIAVFVYGDSARAYQACGPWQVVDDDGRTWTATLTQQTASMPGKLTFTRANGAERMSWLPRVDGIVQLPDSTRRNYLSRSAWVERPRVPDPPPANSRIPTRVVADTAGAEWTVAYLTEDQAGKAGLWFFRGDERRLLAGREPADWREVPDAFLRGYLKAAKPVR